MKKYAFLLFFIGILLLPSFVLGATITCGDGYITEKYDHGGLLKKVGDCCIAIGDCNMGDIFTVAYNASDFIFGISASLALLFFILGGFMFLISGGNQQNVDRGKRMIKASVLGLIIIFTSWIIIDLIVNSLTGEGVIFGSNNWFEFPLK